MFRRLGHEPPATEGSNRRQFLRRTGVAGALSAAVIGGAEVTGLSPAFATTRHPARRRSCNGHCTNTYSPRKCNGGKSCPSGQCCFHYSCEGSCGSGSGYHCVIHSCSNFTTCCP